VPNQQSAAVFFAPVARPRWESRLMNRLRITLDYPETPSRDRLRTPAASAGQRLAWSAPLCAINKEPIRAAAASPITQSNWAPAALRFRRLPHMLFTPSIGAKATQGWFVQGTGQRQLFARHKPEITARPGPMDKAPAVFVQSRWQITAWGLGIAASVASLRGADMRLAEIAAPTGTGQINDSGRTGISCGPTFHSIHDRQFVGDHSTGAGSTGKGTAVARLQPSRMGSDLQFPLSLTQEGRRQLVCGFFFYWKRGAKAFKPKPIFAAFRLADRGKGSLSPTARLQQEGRPGKGPQEPTRAKI